MYSNIAHLGLLFSLLISIFATIIPFFFSSKNVTAKIISNSIIINFIVTNFAFIALAYAYLSSDFSLLNVYNNSHLAIPTLYKFTGIWSNHEGSMMLWLFILANSNFIALNLFDNNRALHSLTLIYSGIALYLIFWSNPFIKISPIPQQGLGFNPLLQDIGLAIHPPILYLGYVTSALSFALAMGALFERKLTKNYIYLMQKSSLFSWSFLLLGIMLGSWWAYRELGWGGYWFWDPVENASLLPLLASTALIHSLYATKKLDTNYGWTIILAITTFLLAILATFFVRSGIVTSIHSFATDPQRGNVILVILSIFTIFSLTNFAINIKYFNRSDEKEATKFLSRFGIINLGNIAWLIAILIILASLFYPLIIESINQQQITIEKSFYERSLIPFLLIILGLIAVGLPATWKEILPVQYRHLAYSIIISLPISILFYIMANPQIISLLAFFIGNLVIIRMGFWYYLRRQSKITFKFYLIWLAHLATALMTVNLSIIETCSKEAVFKISEGEIKDFADFRINFIKKQNIAVDNYLAGRAILNIERNNEEITTLTPEVRYYPVEKSQTSESSIYHHIFYDLYAVINESSADGAIILKLYYKPLMSWLWLSIALIFFSSFTIFFSKK